SQSPSRKSTNARPPDARSDGVTRIVVRYVAVPEKKRVRESSGHECGRSIGAGDPPPNATVQPAFSGRGRVIVGATEAGGAELAAARETTTRDPYGANCSFAAPPESSSCSTAPVIGSHRSPPQLPPLPAPS